MAGAVIAELVADPARLAPVVQACGLDQSGTSTQVEALPCELTNMTTADLARVRFGNGSAASVIVKVSQSPRHSPVWAQIPPHLRGQALHDLPWHAEAELYASPLADLLPQPLRMPQVYAVTELGDDRVAIWMEDVEDSGAPWSSETYYAAAVAWGAMAGALSDPVARGIPVLPRDLRSYFFGRVLYGALPALNADSTWLHPVVRSAVDHRLRDDLFALAERAPAIIDTLDDLPVTLAHGDACPQNLLRPPGEPGRFVAIDWTFAGVCPIGMDVGQLLAGHAEAGALDPADMQGLFDTIVDGYIAGLHEQGMRVNPAAVRTGAIGNVVIRSAFTALPLELLDDEETAESHRQLFETRAGYARFLVDLAGELRVTPEPRLSDG